MCAARRVQSDDKMASVVADMTLAEASLSSMTNGNQSDREALKEYVLEMHGLTQEEYDSTMMWYARNQDDYYEFCDKVVKELRRKRAKVKGASLTDAVVNDLWPYARMAVISPLGAKNGFDFSVPTVDVKSGERVRLKLRFNYSADGKALFGVEYDNGSQDYITSTIKANRIEMTVQTDTARTVKRIFGNLALSDGTTRTLWMDSISLSSMPFDSTEYYRMNSQRQYRNPSSRRRPKIEPKDTLI